MANKEKITISMMIIMAVLVSFSLITFPSAVKAEMKVEPIKGMNYNANASLAENLKTFTGKKVNVTLNSGENFTGTVKTVGTHLVHLEKLEGKEYYDALIRIDDIAAVDARFREPK